MDEIGDNAPGLREALGGPVRRAGSIGRRAMIDSGIGNLGHSVHFRPRALPGFASVTRGISCDCNQSCTTLIR